MQRYIKKEFICDPDPSKNSPIRERTVDIFKQALEGDVRAFISQLGHVWEDWTARLSTAFIVFFSLDYAGYYGDLFFLGLLCKLMVFDLIFGAWDSKRNGLWNTRVFVAEGLCKFPVYWLYIYLVASANVAVSKIVGKCLPGLDICITFFIIIEICSILKHIHRIGFHVPEFLLWFAFGFRKKMERHIQKYFPETEDFRHSFDFDKKDKGVSNESTDGKD